jgi:hypothetical protein
MATYVGKGVPQHFPDSQIAENGIAVLFPEMK